MKQEAFCPSCEEFRATKVVERKERYTVRGRKIEVPVRAEVCAECGEALGSDEQDQQVLDAVHAEYRSQADLLTPKGIKEVRNRYRLSQKSFAALLGMSEATINRYEQGALQDPAHDTAIRACERPEVVRDLLERRGHMLSDWQRKRVEAALSGQPEPRGTWVELPGRASWIQTGDEVSDRTGYRRFDCDRYFAVVLWFCGKLGGVWKTSVNKLVFYADYLSTKTRTVSLTGTAYRKALYGPVPTDYGILLEWMEGEGLLECREVPFPNGNTGFRYTVGPNAPSGGFSFGPDELRVLEEVARQLGRLGAKALSERSHKEPAWRETPDGQLISYEHARNLSLSMTE